VVCLADEVITREKGFLMPTQETKANSVRAMCSGIAERYDFANHFLSFGLDFLWRRRAARIVRDWKPGRILDLATGSGDLGLSLRTACPEAQLIGGDFCLPMLRTAQKKGLANLIVADGMRLPFRDEVFDVLTVAFGLRNMESWPGALGEMRRVLKPGGHLLVLDFSVPPPPLRWVYRPYLHSVLPRMADLVTGEKAAYDYLGDSIEKFPCGRAMCELMEGVGFREAKAEPLSGGIVTLYTAAQG
jgi:demethylmenaquinone methyltransferase/2-methoxy-6-polyprenyl-1,4-benzoquinol methylase